MTSKFSKKSKKSIFVTWFNVETRDFKMWPFKISGKNNAKMCLRTNALNGKKIGEGFFLKYFILIFIHQTTSTCHNKLTKAWRYTSRIWIKSHPGDYFNLKFMSWDLKHYLYPQWISRFIAPGSIWVVNKNPYFITQYTRKQYRFYDSHHHHIWHFNRHEL